MYPKKARQFAAVLFILAACLGCGEYDVPGYGIHVECDEAGNCAPATPIPNTPKPVVTYFIWVRTGKQDKADTDGDVYITLFGVNGRSDRIELDTESNDDFEKGAYDWYSYTSPNLGELDAVCIEHKNSGEKYGWYLEEIVVESDEDNRWVFRFGQWLADDDQTGDPWTCQRK